MKKTLKLDASTPLVIHQNHKGRLNRGNELRLEIHRRKINIYVSGKNKQQLIAILLENDKDVIVWWQRDEEAIEREYAAEKCAEDENDVDSEGDESPNLDDPEVYGNLVNDFQA